MWCQICGHKQDTGNFCGKCGAQVKELTGNVNQEPIMHVTDNAAAQSQLAQQQERNIHLEKLAGSSKKYWGYYLHYLKRPSQIFEKQQQEFGNGMISILLFLTMIGLTLFFLWKKISSALFSGFPFGLFDGLSGGISFIPIFGLTFIFTSIALAIITVSLFIANKYFGPMYSFKVVLSAYGAMLVPVIALTIGTLLFMLIGGISFSFILLTVIFTFSFTILPIYILTTFLKVQSTSFDILYGISVYYILSSILFYIFYRIFLTAIVGSIIGMLGDLF